jgi:hypothetical protein
MENEFWLATCLPLLRRKVPFKRKATPDGKSPISKEKLFGIEGVGLFWVPPGQGVRRALFSESVLGASKLGWMP